jgi:5-methyltetrahydropteroyltriglutamate--homocysteine methyltransferase
MCASLAAHGDPTEELQWAVSMLRDVLAPAGRTRTGLHVCRGNWSRDERTPLRGGYAPLATWLDQVPVTQLVLEYATPRAGEVIPIGRKELGLGVVNPRSESVEAADEIVARVETALRVVPRDRVFLNPDCGFGTFAARPINDAATAERKLAAMVEAARRLRLS